MKRFNPLARLAEPPIHSPPSPPSPPSTAPVPAPAPSATPAVREFRQLGEAMFKLMVPAGLEPATVRQAFIEHLTAKPATGKWRDEWGAFVRSINPAQVPGQSPAPAAVNPVPATAPVQRTTAARWRELAQRRASLTAFANLDGQPVLV